MEKSIFYITELKAMANALITVSIQSLIKYARTHAVASHPFFLYIYRILMAQVHWFRYCNPIFQAHIAECHFSMCHYLWE